MVDHRSLCSTPVLGAQCSQIADPSLSSLKFILSVGVGYCDWGIRHEACACPLSGLGNYGQIFDTKTTYQDSSPMQDSSFVLDSFPVQDSSSSSKRIRVDLENLPSDPRLRQKISSYHPNNHDEIRRHYLTKGPCQPVLYDYPVSYFSKKPRRFRSEWYVGRKWLEYSIDKDAAFCFYCYLFGWHDVGKQGGGETFVTKGFKLWNQLAKLDSHVRGVNSTHNQVVKKNEDLLKEKQHIQSVLVKQSNKDILDYRVQLNAIVDCMRFLLCWRLAFRGHDESQGSSVKGNFLELLQFLGDHNESINEVLQTAPKNCKLTHSDIQKDIVNAIACETSKAIINDLDNGFFSILVDESHNISVKEQMSLVLRYVNEKGIIIERFLGIVYVASTTALSLKCAIECLLYEHNLSLSNLRGQGYDGASNMQVSGRPRRNTQRKTNLPHYRVELFYTVIDMQLQELNNRFSEVNTDLLLCMACLNPSNSFVAFDKEKLILLTKFYPYDFLGTDILALDSQL
ncbi:uncharacterized protein LOC126704867 [Quercus robur]|uniref:uncharacterized protein LOC126704867 n=1 Tax=Quercus robur TaxID=38942 RepID=UPI0021625775|nr:uncharacterized protein LOC126704867 [Quercus robur]